MKFSERSRRRGEGRGRGTSLRVRSGTKIPPVVRPGRTAGPIAIVERHVASAPSCQNYQPLRTK
jgi:hypothetical protein